MKIAVFGLRGIPDVPGGVETHCQGLYPTLVKLGCEVTIFTRSPYIAKEKRVTQWNGVRFIHLWTPKHKSMEAITHSFMSTLMACFGRYDLVHVHAIGPALLIPILKLFGRKVVLTHHGSDYERSKWGWLARTILRAGARVGVKNADGVIAISNGIKDMISQKYSKEAYFIPNGVELPSATIGSEGVKRWGLLPKQYVLTVARFVPEKGLLDLIRAYKRIEKPGFKLVIAGDADHETDYSNEVKRLAEKVENVFLTGYLSGEMLAKLYANAGLFALCSYHEGLPIALLEALSHGLDVLVSDIPQHKEVQLDPLCYFETGNVDELSEKLVESFSKKSKDESNGYLLMLKTLYNWDRIAEKTKSVYEQVLNEPCIT